MDGYKIKYISTNGDTNVTWFGSPQSNMGIEKLSKKEIMGFVTMMFNNAHRGCKILSTESCSYDDYIKISNLSGK